MKNTVTLLIAALIGFTAFAQDTFSIIAVDPATGEIGSAGASCVNGVGAGGIIDIITKIIPGKGGINSQAYVCIPNVNLNNGITQMEAGLSPSEIIDYLVANDACNSQNFNPAYRQYGIADLDDDGNPRLAGWTGGSADDYKEDRQGATFSIQGNILLNVSVIDQMEANFNNTTGTLADKLMAAMQGANFAGADARCLTAGTSSTTAYLLVYAADDDPNDPSIRLNVGQQASGTEPIDILQDLYNELLSTQEVALKAKIKLFPNPVTKKLTLNTDPSIAVEGYEVFDANGRSMIKMKKDSLQLLPKNIDVSKLSSGAYFIKITSDQGEITLQFIKE